MFVVSSASIAAVHESAVGPNEKSRDVRPESEMRGKTDISGFDYHDVPGQVPVAYPWSTGGEGTYDSGSR
jgi:hypothetical protein